MASPGYIVFEDDQLSALTEPNFRDLERANHRRLRNRSGYKLFLYHVSGHAILHVTCFRSPLNSPKSRRMPRSGRTGISTSGWIRPDNESKAAVSHCPHPVNIGLSVALIGRSAFHPVLDRYAACILGARIRHFDQPACLVISHRLQLTNPKLGYSADEPSVDGNGKWQMTGIPNTLLEEACCSY
jgi:hypothetical protein